MRDEITEHIFDHYCPLKKKDNAISYLKIDSYNEIVKNRFENVSSNLIILRETTKAQDESRENSIFANHGLRS